MVWGEKGLVLYKEKEKERERERERGGRREGAKEGESRAQGMGKFILRLDWSAFILLGPALFTLE